MSEEEEKAADETVQVVEKRDSSYGGFTKISEDCQKIKDILHAGASWENLHPSEKEGLEMIVHKICRIINSPMKIRDSWLDIGGYSRCTLISLDKDNVKWN